MKHLRKEMNCKKTRIDFNAQELKDGAKKKILKVSFRQLFSNIAYRSQNTNKTGYKPQKLTT
jgi:hypothetical protein